MKTKKLQQKKRFYGIRYLGGNPLCTTGEPNSQTGFLSLACAIVVFASQHKLKDWLADEDLLASVGDGGGERIPATKAECREHCLGETMAEFEQSLRLAFQSKSEKIPSCIRPIFKENENERCAPDFFFKLSIYSNHISLGSPATHVY